MTVDPATLGFVDPATLGRNLFIIMAGVFLLTIILLVAFFGWGGLRAFLWDLSFRRMLRERHRIRYRPDGTPYPPLVDGVCRRCGPLYQQVYDLPSGERLCPACYEASLAEEAKKARKARRAAEARPKEEPSP